MVVNVNVRGRSYLRYGQYPSDYLHYYAVNAVRTSLELKTLRATGEALGSGDIVFDPSARMYRSIMNGRRKNQTSYLRPNAFRQKSMNQLASASGRVEARKALTEAREGEIEALLTNTWFHGDDEEGGSYATSSIVSNMKEGLKVSGMSSPGGGDMMQALRSFENDYMTIGKLSSINDFYNKAKEVLQKILDAGNIKMLADAYAQEVLDKVRAGQRPMTSKIAQQIIKNILTKHQGEFFNILDPSSAALNTDELISQMALLVAALPVANYTPGQSVKIGTHHASIENLLLTKLDSWLEVLSKTTYAKANAVALGNLIAKGNKDISDIKVSFVRGDNKTYYKEDPLIKAHEEEARQISRSAKEGIKTETLSVEITDSSASARVYLYAPETAKNDVIPLTQAITFTLAEQESLLKVLESDIGMSKEPNFIHDLIQILTYRDVTENASTGILPTNLETGYEARAEKTWEEIKTMLPYLFLVNKMTGLLIDAPQRFDTAFFALGNQILPANMVLTHIFNTLGENTKSSNVYAQISGNVDRSAFVRINKYRRKIISNASGERTWVPNKKLALARSIETSAQAHQMLSDAKITIRLNLAQIAMLSMSNI